MIDIFKISLKINQQNITTIAKPFEMLLQVLNQPILRKLNTFALLACAVII